MKYKPRIAVGTANDYHEGKSKYVSANTIVTYKMNGYDLTIELNDDGSINIRSDNGGLSVEPVVANVVRVRGLVRLL